MQLIAVSPDSPEVFKSFEDYKKISYTLLSDNDMNAAKAFGVAFQLHEKELADLKQYKVDLEKMSGKSHFQLPVPAIFIVDANGIVRFVHLNVDYTTRISAEEVQKTVHSVLA